MRTIVCRMRQAFCRPRALAEIMAKDPEAGLQEQANLRIDRSHGDPAPHKPCLLLMILGMADGGEIPIPDLDLTPDLI